jgi:hypothetical protein
MMAEGEEVRRGRKKSKESPKDTGKKGNKANIK